MFICLCLLCYCSALASADNPPSYNVIMIDITALRADHLSYLGYKKKTSPYIDQFAKESVVFTQAISQAHWTLPSVTSVLTSLYVPSHSIDSRNKALTLEVRGITDILKSHGYRRLAFVGGLDLAVQYNLKMYFDEYAETNGALPMGSLKEGFSQALSWIRSNPNDKFFMFIQGYDVHPPFNRGGDRQLSTDHEYRGTLSGKEINYQLLQNVRNFQLKMDGKETLLTQKDIDFIIAAYDNGIAYADQLFGEFIRSLKGLGKQDNTIIVLFSDHGEELHDHGSFDRFGTKNYFDEVLRVPLIISHPLQRHTVINSQVELIDILPTILEYLDLKTNSSHVVEGKSLKPLIEGTIYKGFKKYVYSGGPDGVYVIRTKDWKLKFTDGKFELYDLNLDPHEKKPVDNPDMTIDLGQRLYEWYSNVSIERFGRNQEKPLPKERLPLPLWESGRQFWNR